MNKFPEMLAYLRRREDLNQQDLADKIGLTRSTVAMYEAGQRKPSMEALESIADLFNVSIDFLIGRVDSGEFSGIFRANLSHMIENAPRADILAAGIDEFEVDLVIRGAIPLTFDLACEIADQLGVSLDAMLDTEESATHRDDGLSEIIKTFTQLSQDNRSKLTELSLLFLNAQHNSGEKK